jgi:RTX calcium-binding nonapeptide repeat (4 copies)
MRMLRVLLVGALTVGIAVLAPVPAGAATITPTVFVDDLTVNGNCTLREALVAANTNAPLDGCAAGSGADVIQLQAGTYQLTLQGVGEDAAATGDLDIVSDVTVQGVGPQATTVAGAWAASTDRIFHLLTTGTDGAINGLTIRDGGGDQNAAGVLVLGPDVSLQMAGVALTSNETTGDVGALWNDGGTVAVRDAVVSANSAANCCSSIANTPGTMTLERVTIDGNTSVDDSGVYSDAALTVIDSTISGNITTGALDTEGAGFLINGGTTSIVNSTISGNASSTDGGGIFLDSGTLTVNNATVTGNTADSDADGTGDGGGIRQQGTGVVTVSNTIIAGNTDTGGQAPDCSGTVTSGGHNLLRATAGCTFASGTGDLVGPDPLLGPLADNGGPTLTHALASGSPAVNAGGPSCAATDQRGAPRSGVCDIGAYELTFCKNAVVSRIGTKGKDTLLGTPAADGFLALGGNDVARGQGGRDTACLGAGKDTGAGGGGKDRLFGEGGKDRLKGQGGNDRMVGGPAKDTCVGGPGKKDQARQCEVRKSVP